MCGIAGWVDFGRDLRSERGTLEGMNATMACRGPDDGAVWCSEHAAIGHRRLAVVDLEGGAQPMRARHGQDRRGHGSYGQDGRGQDGRGQDGRGQDGRGQDVVLTFSGEIYNFRELRRELAALGHAFATRSDTEVLLRSYIEWGRDCVTRLNGMFAFAIWDESRQELLLARDRLGVKPLYYAPLPAGALFGSEPKAILAHSDVRAEIDAEGLAELFSQFGARTPGHAIYRGLAEVRPGCTVRIGRDGADCAAYWRLEAREHADDLSATIATVRDLLTDIVERQLVADVPLCSLLSGGLDSSVVAALAARAVERDDRAELSTFSVDFTGSAETFRPDPMRPSYDEPFARAAAEHIGSRHRTITLDAAEMVAAQWSPLAAHDLPTMGDVYVSIYLLFREVRQTSTVALSGESADEVFAGYPWYHEPAMLAAPGLPWAVGGSWTKLLRPEAAAQIRLDEYAADRYADGLAEVPRLPGEEPGDRRIREVLYLGLTRWLPTLLDRKDRLSMATGLEVRVPFCDHRLVDYVWNVPWAMKETGGIEKGLLRAAAADLLPPGLLSRRKSSYPATADPVYDKAIDSQVRDLLTRPADPLFTIVDHARLAAAYAADPSLSGVMAVQPSATAAAAFLLDVSEWLRRYRVGIA